MTVALRQRRGLLLWWDKPKTSIVRLGLPESSPLRLGGGGLAIPRPGQIVADPLHEGLLVESGSSGHGERLVGW